MGAASTFVLDTPDEGRSRRQSTILVSAATRSALLQLASPPKSAQKFANHTPDNSVNFGRVKVVEETPDDMQDSVLNTSEVPASVEINPKAILKTKHGPKERNLPTLLPSEHTFVAQSQRSALSSTVIASSPGGSEKKRGRKPKSSSVSSLNVSGVGPLSPDVKSANKENKRRGRRSNVSRDEFLSFVFQKESSPQEPTELSPVKESIAAHGNEESDSSDDGWEEMKNSDGSIKKFLPKANDLRKSVVISGNIKSSAKIKLGRPKGKKRVNKKLHEELARESNLNEEKQVSPSSAKNFTMIDESNITNSRRKSKSSKNVHGCSP